MKVSITFLLFLLVHNAYGEQCQKDFQTYCSIMPMSFAKREDYRCLRRVASRLEPSCQTYLISLVKDPCFKDQVKNCDGQEKDLRNQDSCFQRIGAKLSAECKKALLFRTKLDEIQQKECSPLRVLCPDPKDNYYRFCLYKAISEKKISELCRKVITLRHEL